MKDNSIKLDEDLIKNLINSKLTSREDLEELETLCEKIEPNIELLSPLFKVLENNPNFNFGNPGNIVRILEQYYQDSRYEQELFASVNRYPTEYNVWMLNRLLNAYDDEAKKEGVALLKTLVDNESLSSDLRTLAKEFIEEQIE